MTNEALYTWIWEGLILGFGSKILVTLILYLFAVWFYTRIVGFDNVFNAMLFVSIPFLAAGIIGLITLNWGIAVAVLMIGFLFAVAISELFTTN